ncbi:MAG: type protein, partial [Candidatus Hydrogenedentes bacterium]|nr:type protein [Candidatus Hydrogenedentota bacterium]
MNLTMQFRCGLLACLVFLGVADAAEMAIRPDKPNVVSIEPQDARFVRFVVFASSSGSQPCIDELEVYGIERDANLALAEDGAKASASSSLTGYPIHRVEHLNDGEYGNSYSWVAAGVGEEWAQIEFPKTVTISKVVFSRDRNGQYTDRAPVSFEVRLSRDGIEWKTVAKVISKVDPIAGPGAIPGPPAPPAIAQTVSNEEQLRYAFLGEEHAWIKTYGRADISPALVPYNGRVKEYPRHVDDDRIPLPMLSSAPSLDGRLDDACWSGASTGSVRVASPYDFARGPLIEYAVYAGRFGDSLYLSIATDQLLSGHVAIVSSRSWGGCGVVAFKDDGLVFNVYGKADNREGLIESKPIDGAFSADLTQFEMRLPLDWFLASADEGLRLGLGIGGKHTDKLGRPLELVFAPFAVTADGPCVGGVFSVKVTASEAVTLKGNVPELAKGRAFQPGETMTLDIPAEQGEIGPQFALQTLMDGGEEYLLHLFRYDPLGKTLGLMDGLIVR